MINELISFEDVKNIALQNQFTGFEVLKKSDRTLAFSTENPAFESNKLNDNLELLSKILSYNPYIPYTFVGWTTNAKTGKKYDLKDADVIAEIGLNDIEMSDSHEDCDVTGEIISLIYKGDHYQALIRTEEEEEFIVDTPYDWNEGDIVGISIPEDKIKLTLKGDISKYEA